MTVYLGNKPVGVTKIVKKEIEKPFLGLGFDKWVGVLDENGVLKKDTTKPFEFNAVGLKEIDVDYAFYFRFSGTAVTYANFPDLISISASSACLNMFSDTKISTTGLNNLERIGGLYGYAAQQMYSGCVNLTSTGLENLAYIGTGQQDCSRMFEGCTGLTKEYFPMLTYIGRANSLGTSTYGIFKGCTGLVEIHFRADMQSVVENLSAYPSKFGATNATIYFDLIGTITVNGVAYARNEKQSIRVDGTKAFVGWKDADGNVVYTSYENNAEPAVGTAVYSDAGTTQVGTVEGVA